MKYNTNGTKNLRHVWSVLCSSSVLDADSNNLSLNNLVEKLTFHVTKEVELEKKKAGATGYLMSVQLELVTRFYKITEEAVAFEIKMDVINAKGKLMGSVNPNNFGIKSGIKNMRIRTKLNQLPTDEQGGDYTLSILVKEAGESEFTEVDQIPLEIVLDYK